MNRLLVLFLLTFPLLAVAQRKIDLHIPNRVIVNFLDHVVYAELVEGKPSVQVDNEYFYYWYNANDIKRTRGGFEGRLLHGLYTDFYMNKNLREKGMFRYGRKTGEWKSWHFNGELKEIYHWKKGVLQGEFRVFDETGKLIQKGTYKDNLFNGKRYIYGNDGDVKIEKYKRGELKVKKEKHGKGFMRRLWRRNKKLQTAVPDSAVNNGIRNAELPDKAAKREQEKKANEGKGFLNRKKKRKAEADVTNPAGIDNNSSIEGQPGVSKKAEKKKEKKEKKKNKQDASAPNDGEPEQNKKEKKNKDKLKIWRMKKVVPAGSENKQT